MDSFWFCAEMIGGGAAIHKASRGLRSEIPVLSENGVTISKSKDVIFENRPVETLRLFSRDAPILSHRCPAGNALCWNV